MISMMAEKEDFFTLYPSYSQVIPAIISHEYQALKPNLSRPNHMASMAEFVKLLVRLIINRIQLHLRNPT